MRKNKWQDIMACIKLIKYGMSVKQSFCSMILFLVIGIALEMASLLKENNWMNGALELGALFLYSAAMFPFQVLLTLDVSGMVQASSLKRTIQTDAMSFLSLCGNLAALTILLLIRLLCAGLAPERAELIWNTLPVVGIMGLGMSIMGALLYKFYIMSIIVLAVIYGFLGGYMTYQREMGAAESALMGGMPIPAAMVFCIAVIILGNGIQYLVARALYKRPFSRGVFGNAAGKKFV